MLTKRILSILVMIPLFAIMGVFGGWPFAIFIAVIMGVAGWEFWRMFAGGGYSPSKVLIIGGSALLVLVRYQFGLGGSAYLLSVLALAAMAVHLIEFEKGSEHSALDFCITVAGLVYLGWFGSYLVSLRALPNGLWWLLLVLPSVWLADTGAFLVGIRFGKHSMAPRLSPKKTWEGYAGGIVFGVVLTAILALLWGLRAPEITPLSGAIVGAVLAILTPLGDLGESMIKRQFGVKDSSNLIPGHGGFMDRLDTWLWAGVIGFYLVSSLFLTAI